MFYRRIDSEVVVMGLIALFSGIMFLQCLSLPPKAVILPRLVSFCVFILSVYRGTGLLLAGKKKGSDRGAQGGGGILWPVSMALMFGYWALTYVLGFMVTTFVFVMMVPMAMGFRKAVPAAALAAVVAFGLTALMRWLFHIPVPGGILFN